MFTDSTKRQTKLKKVKQTEVPEEKPVGDLRIECFVISAKEFIFEVTLETFFSSYALSFANFGKTDPGRRR